MLQPIKALLLVGGEGTRLRSVVPATPKPLAGICGRPFLELLIQQLRTQGIRDLVLCTGYHAEQIEAAFRDGSKLGVSIEYSRERTPLGTGGAIKLAANFLQGSNDFVALNGDSFLEIDFKKLIGFHHTHAGVATIAAVPVADTSRYGSLQIEANRQVISFAEKSASHGPGLINAGVYVFRQSVLEQIPEGQVSLEKDVLPHLLKLGLYASEQHGIFIDIGTPADYARAQVLYDRLSEAALHACIHSSGDRA
jgi:D-glycero-alpha-D-manno-heptose 1-phosphate guanylyltransferase